ncbi:malectin domain-containing carbohydrate-binding protein [Planotetraspora sp. A-T 1434]|uniref:malectin domain-containing carbohydrate-binding protein n=1 Tax=Planotetraspora sp. A-T 1434 TaxID=2979219 RepID=UPI0021BFB2FC|nr:malectin domain-containing carbohydrate-binding protein [Planotetraspora sp. A-T 1434]MCT9934361.1 malectin domain-containing carbohydrate-binding protein [Planotetraspora sp. A-T 1434]
MRRLPVKRLLLAAALLLGALPVTLPATTAQAAAPAHLYVAPNGSDEGPGTASRPFRTLQRARDAVRAVTADTDVVVYVRRGDYYVDAPIEFTAQDSGRAGHRVTYRVWGGPPGSARFIGGQRVTGWTQYKGDIWQAKVGYHFDALYEDGVRAIKARTPNLEPSDLVTAHAHYWTAETGDESFTVLHYKSGDFDPAGWDLRDAQLRIWPRANWFEEHQPIASVDPVAHTITLKNQTRHPIGQLNYPSRFYVQGMLSALDQPGEFHYDSTAGVLYYWPRHGLGDVVAPRTKTILSLNGTHDVTFDGLGFEDTDFTDFYRHGYPFGNESGENHQYAIYDRQIEMAPNRTGMIFMTDTANVTITRSHLRNSGYSAIYALFANHDDRIESNLIEHTGYAGVFFEGHYPGEGDVLTHNVLAGNLIHDVGELVGHGSGYILMQSSNNEISSSEIYNSPRFGVYLAGYRDIPNQDLYTRDNTVRNLNIHDVMQDSRDGAGVYTFGTSTSPTGPFQVNTYDQIAVNYAYSHPEASNSQAGASTHPAAVYLDEGTYGSQVSNVKAENIQRKPVFKTNKSAGVVTNSSWQPDFDESKLDYPNIGLRADFPYGALTIDAGSSTDQQFLHGTRATATGTTAPDATYRHGTFSYRLPVPNGTYAVDLSFLDPLSTAAGQRVFSVTAEGQTVISDLDAYQVAGHNPVNRQVRVTVTDGQLDLAFTPTTGEALVSAIAALPQ